MIQCHGVQLFPEEAEEADRDHPISVERVEDEYYVRIGHEMNKKEFTS